MSRQEEKRRYRRIEDEIRVTVTLNDLHTSTSTQNLGKGGAFVCLPEWSDSFTEHSEVDLEITLPPREDKIAVKGKVAYIVPPPMTLSSQRPTGIGIEFISFKDGDDQKLALYLERMEQIWDFTESN